MGSCGCRGCSEGARPRGRDVRGVSARTEPVDDEFLKTAQLSYAQLIAIVRASADDAAVLAGIAAASPAAIERLRLWSLEMPVRRRTMMKLLDLDDGYDRPAWLNVPIAAVNAAFLTPLIGLARIVRPLKA